MMIGATFSLAGLMEVTLVTIGWAWNVRDQGLDSKARDDWNDDVFKAGSDLDDDRSNVFIGWSDGSDLGDDWLGLGRYQGLDSKAPDNWSDLFKAGNDLGYNWEV